MCGIGGILNYHSEEQLKSLQAALFHRGPDEQNLFVSKNLALVHTRLSIQDIAHGQQPLRRGNCAIVFNGQIYNHLELRKNYLLNESFTTNSDTETLLAMYQKFGESMFEYLDGMFAFAILDQEKNRVLLARDRAGKKPLYYYQDSETFIFSSELNALRKATPLKINHEAISNLLRTGFCYKENTPYQNTFRVLGGQYLSISLDSLRIEKNDYFNLLDLYLKPRYSLPLNESLLCVEESLRSAVFSRLAASELEVGAFLSGGIDSSLIVAMAAEKQSNLKTFTIQFSGAYDESPLAKLTAEKYGTEHINVDIQMNVEEDLEKILLGYGEPFLDSSAIPSYYVAKEAKRFVSVALNGDGADELFAGYRRYVPIAHRWQEKIKKIAWLTKLLPKPHNKQSKYNYFYRLLSIAQKTGLSFYTSATIDSFDHYYTFPENDIDNAENSFIESVEKLATLSPLSKMLYLDFNLLLFGDLLTKMDIATMAHSLEVRSPFLSKEMLLLAPTLPDRYKIHGTQTKFILRKLAEKYLPKAIPHQPKRGFEIPLKDWINNLLEEKLHHYLENSPQVSAYVSAPFIQNLLHRKISVSEEKRAKMLWSLLCTEIWLRHQ